MKHNTTHTIATFPVVGGYGTDLDVVEIATVALVGSTIVGYILDTTDGSHRDERSFAAGELNSAIRYAASLAGHDLDVVPPAGH